MDQSTHEVRLANWTKIIEQCQARPKGQSARQWLADNSISEKQYYYWLRRVRRKALEHITPELPALAKPHVPAVTFSEIPLENIQATEDAAPAVVIKTKNSTIEVSSGVSETLAVKLMKVIAHVL